MVKIAVDAMGGDNAPGEIVAGAVMAAQSREDIQIFLIGKEEVVSEELKKHTYKKEQIEVVAVALSGTGPARAGILSHAAAAGRGWAAAFQTGWGRKPGAFTGALYAGADHWPFGLCLRAAKRPGPPHPCRAGRRLQLAARAAKRHYSAGRSVLMVGVCRQAPRPNHRLSSTNIS